eukprot:g17945.t1
MGLNLPATQGSSNAGNFLPGVYRFDYIIEDLRQAKWHQVTAVRLPVNVAIDQATLLKLQSYLAEFEGRGLLLCFFESTDDTLHAPHGQGRLSGAADVAAAADCWRRVHEVLGKGPVLYEIFNEPFGYQDRTEYLLDMLEAASWMAAAMLMMCRCCDAWDGLGSWAITSTRNGFRTAFSPVWVKLGEGVVITEFGAALDAEDGSEDASCLEGLALGLERLHRAHNAGPEAGGVASWPGGMPIAIFRKAEMTYLVTLNDPDFSAMPRWGWRFEQILSTSAGPSEDRVPIQCWRSGESTMFCHAEWQDHAVETAGMKFEKIAFYAFPPFLDGPGLVEVYEFRKEAMTYYAHRGSCGFENLDSTYELQADDEKAILPLAPGKQRRMNLNALAIAVNLLLPWCVFCFVCCTLSFSWHYQAPMLAWSTVLLGLMLAAFTAKLAACSEETDPKWPGRLRVKDLTSEGGRTKD